MNKKAWGIFTGVTAILTFYLTVGVVAAWYILDAIAGATNTSAGLFDNWWQTLMLALAIVSAVSMIFGAVMFFGKRKTVSRGFFNASVWGMFTTFFAIAMAIVFIGDTIAAQYASQINKQFDINPYEIIETGEGEQEDTEYYKSSYYKEDGSYDNQAMRKHSLDLAMQVATEGSVLLWNENNALPLVKDTKVNLFGVSSVNYAVSLNGSGRIEPYIQTDMKTALEQNGLKVNANLFGVYKMLRSQGYVRTDSYGCPGVDGNNPANYVEAAIGEAPWSALDSTRMGEVTTSLYKDAAVMFITRMSGEEQDTYRYGGERFKKDECFDDNYMDLSKNEADILAHLQTLKGEGKLNKIILVINAGLAVQFKNIRNYGIDACLWAGVGGNVSYDQIGALLSGKANPSGHLTDTYVYDNFSAPATENFGNFTFGYSSRPSGLPAEATYTHNDKYVVYKEGIYVGYRYYETRYADAVENNGNASGTAGVTADSGNWKYTDEVAYPFGHGLSYTTFQHSGYSVEKKGADYQVSMTIKNTGSVPGKDVMEIYLQKPYTEYDQNTGVEKSAVELVGFAKTKELAAGESQTLTVTVKGEEFKTYDSCGKKTYIVEKGDYYMAAGYSAHDALNNILAAKGYTVANGMDKDGDSRMSEKITIANDDYETYSVSSITGKPITNQFDNADVNLYEGTADQKLTYLSRKDWQGTYPTAAKLAFNAKIVADMAYGPTSVDVPQGMEMPKFGTVSEKFGELNLAMLKDVEFENEYWDALLDQLDWEEACLLIANDRRGAPSVGLPGILCNDGPFGIWAKNAEGLDSKMCFPCCVNMAATWNEPLLKEMGDAFGMEILHIGYTVIYGPGANIHRSAFSGRNGEYYSEDGFLSGKMLSAEVQGLQGRGIIVCTKHFTLNEQERNRYGGTAWANEQSIRELYLKSFEAGFTEGKMNGVMTSFSRIGCTWSGAHHGLLTGVCRDEWDFNGYFTTDAAVGAHMTDEAAMVAGVLAGQDTWLGGAEILKFEKYKNNAMVCNAIREACHRILYTRLHSSVMNGVSTTSKVVRITTWWEAALDTAKVGVSVVCGLCAVLLVLSFVMKNNKNVEEYEMEDELKEEAKAEKKAVKVQKKSQKSGKKSSGKKKKGNPLAVMIALVMIGGVAAGAYVYLKPQSKPDDPTLSPSDSTPSDSTPDDEPDQPDTPVIEAPVGKEYRFEAEEARLVAGNTYGGLSISNENGTSSEWFVGNFSGNLGASIIFYVEAEKEGDVTFTISLSKCNDRKAVTEMTAIFVNDEWFESPGTLPAREAGEAEWITFCEVNLGKIHLKQGSNTIELTQMTSSVGFNVNRISLYAEDNALNWGAYERPAVPKLDATKAQYLFEAENATLDGQYIHIEEQAAAHGGKVIGGVNDAGLNVSGTASITYVFTSDRAEEAILALGLCMPTGSIAPNGFTVTLNGVSVKTPEGIDSIVAYDPADTTSWFESALCGFNTLNLVEGENTLRFVINNGATCNFDYIILNTDAVLTGGELIEAETPNPDPDPTPDFPVVDPSWAEYRFEGESARLKGTHVHIEENAAASGGAMIGGVNDASLTNAGKESITFTFTSDKEGAAGLFMGLALPTGSVTKSAFTVLLNGQEVPVSVETIVPKDEGYAPDWFSAAYCEVTSMTILKGENTLTLVINGGAQCNLDYIVLKTDATLELIPYVAPSAPVVDPTIPSYRFEAEKAVLAGPYVHVEESGDSSGGAMIGGVNDANLNAPGEASITFTVHSDSAANAVLSLGLCMPTGSVNAQGFTILVNGVEIELAIDSFTAEGYSASWFVGGLCPAANISLQEGVNEIKFIVNSGAQCNFDYIELNTEATLS